MQAIRHARWIAVLVAGVLATAAAPAAIAADGIDLGDDTMDVRGVYRILDDDTIGADARPRHRRVFERFAEVIPADLRPDVTHFVAIDLEGSGGTDGAMQQPVEKDSYPVKGQYYIALDTSGASQGAELERTIVHEFAHLFTLRPDQVIEPTRAEWLAGDDAACPMYADPECPLPGSYIADYYAAFPSKPKAKFDPDVYATHYAATHPLEDIAEVFTEWVHNDEDPSVVVDDGEWREVTPGSVLDMKLDFFDGYPELVEAKARIRDGLEMATPSLDIGWPVASIPRDLAVDCVDGAADTEVQAWKVASCSWNDEAEATYVYFRDEADLAEWWRNERGDIARKSDPTRRCKNERSASGIWRYGDNERAGRLACDVGGADEPARLAWTNDDVLVGVRVVRDDDNLRRLVNRWNAGDFDLN